MTTEQGRSLSCGQTAPRGYTTETVTCSLAPDEHDAAFDGAVWHEDTAADWTWVGPASESAPARVQTED